MQNRRTGGTTDAAGNGIEEKLDIQSFFSPAIPMV